MKQYINILSVQHCVNKSNNEHHLNPLKAVDNVALRAANPIK